MNAIAPVSSRKPRTNDFPSKKKRFTRNTGLERKTANPPRLQNPARTNEQKSRQKRGVTTPSQLHDVVFGASDDRVLR